MTESDAGEVRPAHEAGSASPWVGRNDRVAYGNSPPTQKSSRLWDPFVVAVGLLILMGMIRLMDGWRLPFPHCWLRKLTGLPCPTCGCTRGLLAWVQGEPGQAFLFNPLFFLACIGVFLWPLLAISQKISGRPWLTQAWARIPRRRVWQFAAVLVALNWLYLWRALPK